MKGPIAVSAASSGAADAAFIPIVDPIESDMADRVQQALRALERADKATPRVTPMRRYGFCSRDTHAVVLSVTVMTSWRC